MFDVRNGKVSDVRNGKVSDVRNGKVSDVRNGKVPDATVWATDLKSYPVEVEKNTGTMDKS